MFLLGFYVKDQHNVVLLLSGKKWYMILKIFSNKNHNTLVKSEIKIQFN